MSTLPNYAGRKADAELLAKAIVRFWKARGRDVTTRLVWRACDDGGAWAIETDMKNGLPPQPQEVAR
jgi:hypothetical protein